MRGALDVALRGAPPGGAEGGRKGRTNICLSSDKPFDRRHPWPQWGWRGTPAKASRHHAACPSTSALWIVPSTSPCSASQLVAKVAPLGREVTESV